MSFKMIKKKLHLKYIIIKTILINKRLRIGLKSIL